MGTRTIKYDDLTGREIEGIAYAATVTLSITIPEIPASEGNELIPELTVEFKAEGWDVAPNSATALQALIEKSDLAAFMLAMRPQISLKSPDSTVIRDWLKANHPELKIGDHGRIPADAMAIYNREVVQRINSADSASK